MAEIQLERLTKVYPDGTLAVSELDLEIGDSEFVVLVGPSGCGKTTALRMVAGLEPITDGLVKIGGRVVNKLQPKDRDIAMVFQNYALYPHMSAFKNMAFALKLRKLHRPEIRRRVGEAARVLGLMEVLAKRPRTLSGGQRQRVAMGRAIVREPQAFLMDEPLSNLDAKLRVEMRAEIARLQRDLAVTTIYVTHDQTEAMTLGDRVAVMRDGVLQQFDSPTALFDRPVNLFVAEFIGSPAMNLVGADLLRSNGGWVAKFGDHELEVTEELLAARPALPQFEGRRLILGIRPEDLEDAAIAGDAPDGRRIASVVDIREDMGSEVLVHFGVGAAPVRGEDVAAAVGAEAIEAGVALLRGDLLQVPSTVSAIKVDGRRAYARARAGEQVELAARVDPVHAVERQLLPLGEVAQAVRRIGEEDRAVRSDDDVVRRVQPLALVRLGQRLDPPLPVDPADPPGRVLAGEQVALPVERQAVGVTGRMAEGRDLGPLRQRPVADRPAVRDVGEEQVVAAPDRPLGEREAGRDPVEHRQEAAEERVRVLEAVLHRVTSVLRSGSPTP
jgi:multiple sugar transport system ATP-binding protein